MRSGRQTLHRFYRAGVVIAGGVVDARCVRVIKKAHMHRHRRAATDVLGHGQVGGIGGQLDLQILVDGGFYVLEVIFALPITFQIHETSGLELKETWLEIHALLLDIRAPGKRQALIPFAL
jgi:hypothetical protein